MSSRQRSSWEEACKWAVVGTKVEQHLWSAVQMMLAQQEWRREVQLWGPGLTFEVVVVVVEPH